MRRWLAFWIGTALCAAILWIVWPYYSALALFGALKARDAAQIETRVDWPSLREGLRNDLNAMILMEARSDTPAPGDPLADGMMAVFGPMMINQLIDAYVTPSGLVLMLAGQTPTQASITKKMDPKHTSHLHPDANPVLDSLKLDRIKYAFFIGPLSFRIDLSTDNADEVVTALFRWSGSWKLTRANSLLTESLGIPVRAIL